jgi:hypothetical protein
MLERWLRRRQGHYLPCTQLFEWLPLSSWWAATIDVAQEQYLITSSALQVQHWLRPYLFTKLDQLLPARPLSTFEIFM